jgi:hypothetical protein
VVGPRTGHGFVEMCLKRASSSRPNAAQRRRQTAQFSSRASRKDSASTWCMYVPGLSDFNLCHDPRRKARQGSQSEVTDISVSQARRAYRVRMIVSCKSLYIMRYVAQSGVAVRKVATSNSPVSSAYQRRGCLVEGSLVGFLDLVMKCMRPTAACRRVGESGEDG